MCISVDNLYHQLPGQFSQQFYPSHLGCHGRRSSYTVDFKIMVVDWLRMNDCMFPRQQENLKSIASVFGSGIRSKKSSRATVLDLRKRVARLENVDETHSLLTWISIFFGIRRKRELREEWSPKATLQGKPSRLH